MQMSIVILFSFDLWEIIHIDQAAGALKLCENKKKINLNICFLLFQTPPPNPQPLLMHPLLSLLNAPLLLGGPPDFSTLRCDGPCLLFWIDLARVLLLEVCQRTDRSHADHVILSHMQMLFGSFCRAACSLAATL